MALIEDYPINEEYLAQTNKDIFDIAQAAVNLAVAVIKDDPSVIEIALELLGTYGDWRNISMSPEHKRFLMVRNYGEDEVQAMEEAGE